VNYDRMISLAGSAALLAYSDESRFAAKEAEQRVIDLGHTVIEGDAS
jgi:hypothetical protein